MFKYIVFESILNYSGLLFCVNDMQEPLAIIIIIIIITSSLLY